MGIKRSKKNSYESNEKFLKETSYEYHMNKKKALQNCLSTDERDYMISKAMSRLQIDGQFRPAVAKAANYLTGDRFWTIFEYAEQAKAPARYFIKAINRELYS